MPAQRRGVVKGVEGRPLGCEREPPPAPQEPEEPRVHGDEGQGACRRRPEEARPEQPQRQQERRGQDQGGAGARVHAAAEGGRDLRDDLGQGEGEVLRQVGT